MLVTDLPTIELDGVPPEFTAHSDKSSVYIWSVEADAHVPVHRPIKPGDVQTAVQMLRQVLNLRKTGQWPS